MSPQATLNQRKATVCLQFAKMPSFYPTFKCHFQFSFQFCAHSHHGSYWLFFPETANMKYRASVSNTNDVPSNARVSGRRTVLPAHSTDNSHIGILTILYNNIGKDLSRVSMPVALNEPLSLLQRVSEELEYSELLDIANRTDDPFERMVRARSIVHKTLHAFYPNCVYQQKAYFALFQFLDI